jgi:competence protein ComEA
MISFNRKEQLAILLLCTALLAGIAVSLIARWREDGLPEFRVIKGAVPVPEAGADEDTTAVVSGAPVNINTASEADLQRLPRIGPKTARRIVEYRARNGRFATLDDLALVSGIGPKTVARLRPLATLGPN